MKLKMWAAAAATAVICITSIGSLPAADASELQPGDISNSWFLLGLPEWIHRAVSDGWIRRHLLEGRKRGLYPVT